MLCSFTDLLTVSQYTIGCTDQRTDANSCKCNHKHMIKYETIKIARLTLAVKLSSRQYFLRCLKIGHVKTQICLQAESRNRTWMKKRLHNSLENTWGIPFSQGFFLLCHSLLPKDSFNMICNPSPIKMSNVLIHLTTWAHGDCGSSSLCT